MYVLIFQPENMLELCLLFNDSQSICVDKRYACKKCIWINQRQDNFSVKTYSEPSQTSSMENILSKLANRFYQSTFLFVNP